jgi:hypothetical protein
MIEVAYRLSSNPAIQRLEARLHVIHLCRPIMDSTRTLAMATDITIVRL